MWVLSMSSMNREGTEEGQGRCDEGADQGEGNELESLRRGFQRRERFDVTTKRQSESYLRNQLLGSVLVKYRRCLS